VVAFPPPNFRIVPGFPALKNHIGCGAAIKVKLYLVGGLDPSEKYESQLGLLFQIFGNKKCSKPPTRYNGNNRMVSITPMVVGIWGPYNYGDI